MESDLRVLMLPHWENIKGHGESGIKRVIEKYFRHLGDYGIELVPPHANSFDLLMIHAGMSNKYDVSAPILSSVHGYYWSSDYPETQWQNKANRDVTESVRHATVVTVPSEWVGMCMKRDMHITPTIVPHGITMGEWVEPAEDKGYVLFGKNRGSDACDPRPVIELAQRFPQVRFLTTFAPDSPPPNVKVTGPVPFPQMRQMILESSVYLGVTKETFSIQTLEAMAAGKAVLGYAWGGTAALCEHGVNSYLARPGDVHELADGLDFVLTHKKVLGENSREMARKWTWENACGKMADACREAVRLWQDVHSRPFTIDEALYRVQDAI